MSAEEKKKQFNIDYENLAIPEIHTGEIHPAKEKKKSPKHMTFDTLAVPEIHIHRTDRD